MRIGSDAVPDGLLISTGEILEVRSRLLGPAISGCFQSSTEPLSVPIGQPESAIDPAALALAISFQGQLLSGSAVLRQYSGNSFADRKWFIEPTSKLHGSAEISINSDGTPQRVELILTPNSQICLDKLETIELLPNPK
jgi:hypothetical protein